MHTYHTSTKNAHVLPFSVMEEDIWKFTKSRQSGGFRGNIFQVLLTHCTYELMVGMTAWTSHAKKIKPARFPVWMEVLESPTPMQRAYWQLIAAGEEECVSLILRYDPCFIVHDAPILATLTELSRFGKGEVCIWEMGGEGMWVYLIRLHFLASLKWSNARCLNRKICYVVGLNWTIHENTP